MTEPKYFKSQNNFRRWLEKYHNKKPEILVGFHRVGTGKPSMRWSESVDQALCFGWIDGVRKSLGDGAYTIRFTPRRPGSNWSAINIKKVEELTKKGLMHPAGIAAFEKRSDKKSVVYSYENKLDRDLATEFERQMSRNKKAWIFFKKQPPWYRHKAAYYVMNAKQEKTRISRLRKLILACEAEERL